MSFFFKMDDIFFQQTTWLYAANEHVTAWSQRQSSLNMMMNRKNLTPLSHMRKVGDLNSLDELSLGSDFTCF